MYTTKPEIEDGESSEATSSGGNNLKTMTPEAHSEHLQHAVASSAYHGQYLVFVVKDLIGEKGSRKKIQFSMPRSASVADLMAQVLIRFKYEYFSLIYYKTPISENGEQIDIHNCDLDKCLGDLNFERGLSSKNHLIICNLNDSHRPKVDEDDLSLGASASPTSAGDDRWYDEPGASNSASSEDRRYDEPAASNSASSEDRRYDEPAASNYDELRESFYSSKIKHDTLGYVGLVNQAMTCYLNSLLQTLFMTPEFRNALYRWEFKGNMEEAAKSIPFQLQRLFLQLQTASKTAVETTNLTRSFGWDSSEVWQQHDIQELYRVMFDALEQCFKNTDQANLINDLYEGKMKDYVKCLECTTENAREDSFLDIPLPIRPFGTSTAYKSVEEALKAFVEPELLTGNNKYECSKCKALCDAHKGLKFTRFPYLLTLHLKRFDFDYQTFHRIKLNDKVTFPNLLDLNCFTEDDVQCKSDTTHISSPDKCFTDKLDDASTTDSGSALEEESSSGDCTSSIQILNDDMQDEDEGIDVSSLYNEKNRLCFSNGPYVYELFSIMVHSGSASGGHYYAYIKDFQTGEWFCFNDQSVSKITHDDIKKTYGGSNSRAYWSSSANAYMLMYRQADKKRNAHVFSNDEFPIHIKDLVESMVREELAEREAKEIERAMCKVTLFCQHPHLSSRMEMMLRVHKDTTLRETTKLAYKELNLESCVPLDRCRLVKYDEAHDNIECSFDNRDEEAIGEVLGGVRSTYKLCMEIRDEDKEFEEYKQGDVTVKVFVVNISTEEVEGPHMIRASHNLMVRQLKELIGRKLCMDPSKMRVVQERFYSELKAFSSDSKLLRDESFYCSSKVFVEASGEEAVDFFNGSKMYDIIDHYQNTVTLYCKLPDCSDESLEALNIPRYVEPEEKLNEEECQIPIINNQPPSISETTDIKDPDVIMVTSVTSSTSDSEVTCSLPIVASSQLSQDKKNGGPSSSSNSNVTSPVSALCDFHVGSNIVEGGNNLSDCEDEGIVDMDGNIGSSSAVNSDQSASEDSSLTSDSDRTLVGEPPEDKLSEGSHSPEYHDASSPEEDNKKKATTYFRSNIPKNMVRGWLNFRVESAWGGYDDQEEEVKRYFRAQPIENNVLRISVDKRITISQIKQELQKYIGVSHEHFKLYKYCNEQEYDCTRMTESLTSFGDNTVLRVALGRPLLPGEYKGKVFLLDPTNAEDPAKFLIDFVIRKGDVVSVVKANVVEEVNAKCSFDLQPNQVRLRKKTWKTPQTIYLDHHVFDDLEGLTQNWELYLQTLENVEEKSDDPEELSVFVKRWRPSTYKTDPLIEVVIPEATVDELKQKLSHISEIPVENVEFARGKGTFPCDMSVLDIDGELDWTQKEGNLSQRPWHINDDGAVIYYRDKTEPCKSLTEIGRVVLQTDEMARLKKDSHYPGSVNSTVSSILTSRTRERGLKIYLSQTNQ